ncbi:MAG: hypothetical protein ACYDBP_06410 [Leptospirales bacterium]
MRALTKRLTSTFSGILLLASGLSLSACGASGNTFGNGSGSISSATGANQVAGIDIANGNYSAAISVLSPFCPNNNCQTADIANTLANAYMAMGNTRTGTKIQGVAPVTGASGGGATVTAILSNLLTLVSGGSHTTTAKITQAIFQAIPCVSTNTCKQTYLDNLATAIQILSNTSCSGSSTSADTATSCPDSSTIMVVDMLYILAATQYDTGLTYTGSSFQVCPSGGNGTTGCNNLSTITTLATSITSTHVGNIAAILDNITVSGDSPTITINNAYIVNVVPYFLSSFGTSSNSSILNPINQFLNSINCYKSKSISDTSCAPSSQSTQSPTSVTFSSQALTDLLSTLNS